ncbi:MAG: hypothetical protein LBK71_00765 [Verrucomicrobiales bacterium]|jgi:hypothetical protein|nr:hypothetical protein [Verrucomicrobiales bacterium]
MSTYTDAAQLPVLEAIEKLPWLGKEQQVAGKVFISLLRSWFVVTTATAG